MGSQKKTFNEKYREAQEKKSLGEVFAEKQSVEEKKTKQKNKEQKIKAPKIKYDYTTLAHKKDLQNLADKADLSVLQKEVRNIRSEFILYLIIAALIQSGIIYAIFKFLI